MILVDSHVHIHDGVDFGLLFASAMRNFDVSGKEYRQSEEKSRQCVLCLTETQAANKFQELASRRIVDDGASPGWEIVATSEDDSLIVSHSDFGEMIVIAGRQIVTSERLEVLAIGTNSLIPDGDPIVEVIHKVQEYQALAVIPWGFGKWVGRRGAVLGQVLLESFHQRIFLGDNSGRLKHWRQPRQFSDAQKSGMRVLPGSDPLPFSGEYKRIGSFGFVLEDCVSNGNASADLKRLLLDENCAVYAYGELENPFRFMRNQLAMQYRVRKGAR